MTDHQARRNRLDVWEADGVVSLGVEQVRVVRESLYPDYAGETTVTPATAAQKLATRDTVLRDDVTVEAIPYFTTTNLSGGYTAIIGG